MLIPAIVQVPATVPVHVTGPGLEIVTASESGTGLGSETGVIMDQSNGDQMDIEGIIVHTPHEPAVVAITPSSSSFSSSSLVSDSTSESEVQTHLKSYFVEREKSNEKMRNEEKNEKLGIKRDNESNNSLTSLTEKEKEKEKDTITIGLINNPLKITKKSLALLVGDGFVIRKGSLVDTGGAVALTFMGTGYLGVNFNEVVFQVQSNSVPNRLILASMNCSLVGIVCRSVPSSYNGSNNNSGSSGSGTGTGSSSGNGSGGGSGNIRKIRLRIPHRHQGSRAIEESVEVEEDTEDNCNAGGEGDDEDEETNINENEDVDENENENVDDNENTNFNRNKKRSRNQNGDKSGNQNSGTEDQHVFDINIDTADPGSSSEEQIPECLGLGIVRGIDVEKQLLYLITPIAVTVLNKFKGKKDRKSILLILISIIT